MSEGATTSAPAGVTKRLFGQHFQRFIIQNIATCVDQAILAMTGVGIERHIGNHPQLWKLTLQRPDNARYQTLIVKRLFCTKRL
jgi:hypothetical protein